MVDTNRKLVNHEKSLADCFARPTHTAAGDRPRRMRRSRRPSGRGRRCNRRCVGQNRGRVITTDHGDVCGGGVGTYQEPRRLHARSLGGEWGDNPRIFIARVREARERCLLGGSEPLHPIPPFPYQRGLRQQVAGRKAPPPRMILHPGAKICARRSKWGALMLPVVGQARGRKVCVCFENILFENAYANPPPPNPQINLIPVSH